MRRYGFRLKRISRPDTAADVSERAKRQEAAEIVTAEISERFPVLNADNFSEAEAYRQRRLAEITG